jgi:hypothetical protein
MQLCRSRRIMSVGYIDPLVITQNTLKLNERKTLNHIINFLYKHHDMAVVELPYNFR